MAKIRKAGGVSDKTAPPAEPEQPATSLETEPDSEQEQEPGWETLTVEELRDELRLRELPVSGSKAELVARLEADDAKG